MRNVVRGFIVAASVGIIAFIILIASPGDSPGVQANHGSLVSISSSSVANPTVVTTAVPTGLKTGYTVTIAGHNSTPSIDGVHIVTVLTSTTFTIPVNVTTGGTAVGTVDTAVAGEIDLLAVDTDITNVDTVNGGAPNGNNAHEKLALGECGNASDDDLDGVVDDGCTGGPAPLNEVGDIDTCSVILFGNISSVTASNPTTITTAAPHGLTSGDNVYIAGYTGGTPTINGIHIVTATGATTFTIPVNVTAAGTGGTFSETHQIDIVVDEIDTTDGMISWSLNLDFDPTVVHVIGIDREMMIASLQGSGTFSQGPIPPPPVTTGQLVGGIVDISTAYESGEGVLERITLGAVGTGISPLNIVSTIPNPIAVFAPPFPGFPLTINSIQDGLLAVGEPCPLPVDVGIITETVNGGPATIDVSQNQTYTIEKEVTNLGPQDPVDAVLTTTVTAPTGCTADGVQQAVITTNVNNLAIGVSQFPNVPFEVHCTEPSWHDFAIVNEIQPVFPVTDTSQANNTVSHTLAGAAPPLGPLTPVGSPGPALRLQVMADSDPQVVSTDVADNPALPTFDPDGAGPLPNLPKLTTTAIGIPPSNGTANLTVTKTLLNDQGVEVVVTDTVTSTGVTRVDVCIAIVSTTVASPTVVTTAGNHGLSNGDTVTIDGHTSTPSINGTYAVSSVTATTFTIPVAVTSAGSSNGRVCGVEIVDGPASACTVTATSTNPDQITLPVNVSQNPTFDFDIECAPAGGGMDEPNHSFEDPDYPQFFRFDFSDTLSLPKDPHSVDTDSGNNSGSGSIDLWVIRPYNPSFTATIDEGQTPINPMWAVTPPSLVLDDDCKTNQVAFPGGLPCEMNFLEETTPNNLITGVATGPAVCPSFMPIVSSTPGFPTAITTIAPHGMSSGDPVAIGGMVPGTVAAPSGLTLNGPYHTLLGNGITVTGATTFDVPYFTTVVSTGGAVGCNVIDDSGGFPAGIDLRGIILIAGAGAGGVNLISVNLGTQLILVAPWTINPGTGSVYLIPIPDQEPDDLAIHVIPRPAFTIASGLAGVGAGPGITNGTAVAYLDFKVTMEVVPGICSVFVGGTGIGLDGALPDYSSSSLVSNGMPDEGPNDGTVVALANPFVWPTRLESNLEVQALNIASAKLIGRGVFFILSLNAVVNILVFDDSANSRYVEVVIFGDPTTVGIQTCPPLIVDLTFAGEVLDGDGDFDGDIGTAGDPTSPPGTGVVNTVRQCDITGTIASPHEIDAIFENNDTKELVLRTDTVLCSQADSDGDGIADVIDGTWVNPVFTDESLVFSDNFTDQHLVNPGTTFGEILNRGGLTVQITERINPDGVTVAASGGGGPATIEACASPSIVLTLNSGNTVGLKCPSAEVQVLTGPVDVTFGTVEATLPTGTTMHVTEVPLGVYSVENPAGSTGSITVGGLTLAPDDLVTGITDTDGDGVVDRVDTCPGAPDPLWTVPANDPDCDGWSSTDEGVIGTEPTLACSLTGAVTHGAGFDNDEPVDNWPADMNDDQVVNLSDILFLAPPVFFSVGPPGPSTDYELRYDLNLDNVINLSDILYFAPPVFFATCTP